MTYFQAAMLPDPPVQSWGWLRSGYIVRHYVRRIFYRIQLKWRKA